MKETQVVKEGGTLILMVTTLGTPTPEIKWYHSDGAVAEDIDTTIESDGTYSRLTVRNATAATAGKYLITAENEVGADSVELDVAIKGQLNGSDLCLSISPLVWFLVDILKQDCVLMSLGNCYASQY